MIDLFEKCRKPSLASELKEKGIYPYFHALESRQAPEVIMEGRRRIMLGSNNYLGLTTCPEVIEAGIKAFEQYGTGCSGSRFLNGTLEMHLELKRSSPNSCARRPSSPFPPASSPIWASSVPLSAGAMLSSAIKKTTPASTMAAN